MLTIICGEDIVSSRQYFFDLKNNLKAKGTQVFEILPGGNFSLDGAIWSFI